MKSEYTPERIITIHNYRVILGKILEHQKQDSGITRSQLIKIFTSEKVPVLNPEIMKRKALYIKGFPSEASLIKKLVLLKKLKLIESRPPGGRKGSYIVLTDYGMIVFLKYQISFWINNFLDSPEKLMILNRNLMEYIVVEKKKYKGKIISSR